jgi:hypothetical protein
MPAWKPGNGSLDPGGLRSRFPQVVRRKARGEVRYLLESNHRARGRPSYRGGEVGDPGSLRVTQFPPRRPQGGGGEEKAGGDPKEGGE